MSFSQSGTASFFTFFILILALAMTAIAQDLDDVTIRGRVTDAAGLAVAGATVSVTERDSGAERSGTTDEEGRYRFVDLRPGTFKVRALANGFGAQERINLETVAGFLAYHGARDRGGKRDAPL